MSKPTSQGAPRRGRRGQATDVDRLEAHLRALISVELTEAPVLSCYASIRGAVRTSFEQRARLLRKTVEKAAQPSFDEALRMIEGALSSEALPATRGFAIFARGGTQPFLLPLQFQLALADRLSIDQGPCIYPLVELKAAFHRYIVMVVNEGYSRVLEVSLGAISKELWRERPELQERVHQGWTRAHYQNHRREDEARFVREEVEVLERLTLGSDHTQLILIGNPRLTAKVRAALPKRLAERLTDVITATARATTADVVASALASFAARELRASAATLALYLQELRRHGLAVAGTEACLTALECGQVDVLLMTSAYAPDSGFCCARCALLVPGPERPVDCRRCGGTDLAPTDVKEALAKLAEQHGAGFLRIEDGEQLSELGGVGALLRYRDPAGVGRLTGP